MQAVILSGGQGTRLRPLTSTMPKPAVPMVNRPMLWYMVDWLAGHGVDRIVMSVGYKADLLRAVVEHDAVEITWVEEPEPLGTAGAVKFAQEHLDDRFLVLNGDVLTDFDISAEIAQHERTGARATLALVPVDDPTAYGLVLTDDENRVESFLEKPSADAVPPNPRINAGGYVLEKDVLELVPAGENKSFEHDVFPRLVGDGIFGFDAAGYWLDLGTPERYVEATRALLTGEVESYLGRLRDADGNAVDPSVGVEGFKIEAPVAIDAGAAIAHGARIGPHSVIGADVTVEADCRVDRSVVMQNSRIAAGAMITDSIIGPNVTVGYGAVVEAGCVIGEGAYIDPGTTISSGARVDSSDQVTAR